MFDEKLLNDGVFIRALSRDSGFDGAPRQRELVGYFLIVKTLVVDIYTVKFDV